MKINWLVRVKNPNFWIGLIGIVLVAMGVDASMFTSWQIVWGSFISLVKNPFMLGAVALAVWGYVQDFTTKGVCDTKLALSYNKPKDSAESENDYELIRAIKEDGYATLIREGEDDGEDI